MATSDPDARRAAIRTLIRSRLVGTQEELRELLAKEGFDVTQATLSRDLAQIGARRVSLPEGGTAYEVDDVRVPEGPDALLPYREMITRVVDTDSLVIVSTLPGAASAVALGIDRARLPQVAGTIAGDDTIFIAPAKGVAPGRLSRQLNTLWSKGKSS
ncbi:MAG: arginine repressor [Myxococcaceae bacterium]|nr:arginine repressor [Myxococcaceae bacterium]